jgi:hypothetical protein
MAGDGSGNASVFDILLSEDFINCIGYGYFGNNNSIHDTIWLEFLNTEAYELVSPSPTRTEFRCF